MPDTLDPLTQPSLADLQQQSLTRQNPRFAGTARKPGRSDEDARAAERRIGPLEPGELTALGRLRAAPLLAPILPAETVALLHGPRGIGLTHLAVGMAVALAAGTSFLGWQAARPAKVLLLGGTMAATTLAGRVESARGALGVELDGRLDLVALGRKAAVLPDLATGEGCHELAVLAARAEVVIIDDLAGLLPGGRLDARAASRLQQCLASLRRDGKCVIVTQADDAEARRGARAVLQRLADLEIRLAWPAGYRPDEGGRFELHIERARALAGRHRLAREVRLIEDEQGRPVWHTGPCGQARRTLFESLLKDGVPVRDAGREAGISQATAYRWWWDVRRAREAAKNDELEERLNRLRYSSQDLAALAAGSGAPGAARIDENENRAPPQAATVGRTAPVLASQAAENENRIPLLAVPGTAVASAEAMRAGKNENRAGLENAGAVTSLAAPSAPARSGENENREGSASGNAAGSPKLNRHLRRKLARQERKAHRRNVEAARPLPMAA